MAHLKLFFVLAVTLTLAVELLVASRAGDLGRIYGLIEVDLFAALGALYLIENLVIVAIAVAITVAVAVALVIAVAAIAVIVVAVALVDAVPNLFLKLAEIVVKLVEVCVMSCKLLFESVDLVSHIGDKVKHLYDKLALRLGFVKVETFCHTL